MLIAPPTSFLWRFYPRVAPQGNPEDYIDSYNTGYIRGMLGKPFRGTALGVQPRNPQNSCALQASALTKKPQCLSMVVGDYRTNKSYEEITLPQTNMETHMSGDQNPYPVSLTVRNLLTVAYETQGLAYGARFS